MENETELRAWVEQNEDHVLLSELLDYLGTVAGTLELIVENLRAGNAHMVSEDGETSDLPPLVALDNSVSSLVAKATEIGCKRVLRTEKRQAANEFRDARQGADDEHLWEPIPKD